MTTKSTEQETPVPTATTDLPETTADEDLVEHQQPRRLKMQRLLIRAAMRSPVVSDESVETLLSKVRGKKESVRGPFFK